MGDTRRWDEVKVESEVDYDQLQRYRTVLLESGVPNTRLILLTRYPPDLIPTRSQPDFNPRWFMVTGWIKRLLDDEQITNDASRYISDQFIEFMRRRSLAMRPVTPDISSGIHAMQSLKQMVLEALASLGIDRTRPRHYDEFRVNCDNHRYRIGLSFDRPESLVFETYKFRLDEEAVARLDLGGEIVHVSSKDYPTRSKWVREFDLTSDNAEFFELDETEQMSRIETFLRQCWDDAAKIELRS